MLAEHRLLPIVVGAMGPGRNLVAAPASEVVATQNYLVHCIGVAEAVGATVVAGPFYAATGRTWRMTDADRAEHYRELQAALTPVVHRAERGGIRLAIEPLNRYETSLVNTVDQALEALGPLLGPRTRPRARQLPPQHRGEATSATPSAPPVRTSRTCRSAATTAAPSATTTSTGRPSSTLSTTPATPGRSGSRASPGENATIAVAASVWRPLALTPGRARGATR